MRIIHGEERILVRILTLFVVIVALFAAFGILAYLAIVIVPVPGELALLRDAALTAIGVILGLISVWAMGRAIYHASHTILGETRARLITKVLTYILYAAVIIAALSRFTDISGYLFSLGIVAVIIGLAAQTVISNLLAGVLVFAGRPFHVGDYVRVGIVGNPVEGRVIDIDFLRCRVETNDQIVVSVPNILLISNAIANYTVRERRPLRVQAVVEKAEDEERFREEVTSKLPKMLEGNPEVKVYTAGYGVDGSTVEVWVDVRTARFLRERSEIIGLLRKLLEKSKIPVRKISVI